jgi:UDP-glucuronate decarboxylase
VIAPIDVRPVIDMLGDDAQRFAGKKVLWTGTNGFLGRWVLRVFSHLNRHVLAVPCELYAIDLAVPSAEERASVGDDEHIRYIAHDLTQKLETLSDPFAYVVHMAGIASPHHYKKRPLETIDVAVEGSRGTLDIARRHDARYLFCSTSEVYQTASVNPTPETYIGAVPTCGARSSYDVSKLMGETLSHVYHRQLGVNTGIIRIFNSMGPGLGENDHRILPRIASSVVRGTKLKVFSNGTLPSRTYCPVANTVAGMFLALLKGKPDEIYNIGLDTPEMTVVELIDRIKSATGIVVDYEIAAAPDVYSDEPMRRCPDITKARREIGYDPRVSLDDGLRAFFDWAKLEYGKRPLE